MIDESVKNILLGLAVFIIVVAIAVLYVGNHVTYHTAQCVVVGQTVSLGESYGFPIISGYVENTCNANFESVRLRAAFFDERNIRIHVSKVDIYDVGALERVRYKMAVNEAVASNMGNLTIKFEVV